MMVEKKVKYEYTPYYLIKIMTISGETQLKNHCKFKQK